MARIGVIFVNFDEIIGEFARLFVNRFTSNALQCGEQTNY